MKSFEKVLTYTLIKGLRAIGLILRVQSASGFLYQVVKFNHTGFQT